VTGRTEAEIRPWMIERSHLAPTGYTYMWPKRAAPVAVGPTNEVSQTNVTSQTKQ
jgi:hypothetical protein